MNEVDRAAWAHPTDAHYHKEKWLMAIDFLRSRPRGWILDKGSKSIYDTPYANPIEITPRFAAKVRRIK